MEISKQIGGFTPGRGRRPAQGGRQEEARPDGDDGGQVHRRLRRLGHRAGGGQGPVVADDRGRRLLVQQVPRRLLRADLLPHRLPEGQLPGRVHGGGDLLGDVDQGQGPVLRQPLQRDGDRGAAARRQLLRPRLRRLGQLDPLRARRGQERRPRRGRGDHRRARGRRARSSRSGTSASGSTRARSTSARSSAWSSAGRSTRPATRAAGCSRCSPRRSPRARRRRRTRAAARARSSTSAAARRRRGRRPAAFAAPQHPPVPGEEFDQRELLRLEKETLGTFLSAHPLAEVRRRAARAGRRPLADVAGAGRRRLGDGRRDRRRGEEGAHAARRLRDVRRPRRPRGPGRAVRPRRRVASRPRRSRSTASSSSGAGSTRGRRAR